MFDNKVFISHSTVNKEIADHFCAYLVRLGVKEKNIFCSSVVGQGISNSEKLNEAISKAIYHSFLLVYIISYDFLKSSYCMEELGVGWYLSQRKQAKCFYLILPDIELSELVGFVNSKIDKFSFLDSSHASELSSLSCDLIKNLDIQMKTHTQITNAESVLLSSIKSINEELIRARQDRNQQIKDKETEKAQLLEALEKAREEIVQLRSLIEKAKIESGKHDEEIELHTIESVFDGISYTTFVPNAPFSSLDKDFWFTWITRYEELLSNLNIKPRNDRVEAIAARVYLSNGNFDEAYRHFLALISILNRYVALYRIEFFPEKYTGSLQEVINILQEYYNREKEGLSKDNQKEVIDFLVAREKTLDVKD